MKGSMILQYKKKHFICIYLKNNVLAETFQPEINKKFTKYEHASPPQRQTLPTLTLRSWQHQKRLEHVNSTK